MRLAARTDRNQTAIVAALRKSGCQVLSLAGIGNGCPDLLACRADQVFLLEIKDGKKSPSRQKLTPQQIKFHEHWPVHLVRNECEALVAVGLQTIEAALNENT
jgi:Holliday junction resolvase